MQKQLFEQFSPVIRSLAPTELNGSPTLNARLRLAQEGDIEVCYAPFEYINPAARIVLVGITPGRTQMLNALKETRKQLDQGADPISTLMAAKKVGAFSGAMRPNLVSLLDCIGVNRWLGIRSCGELFGTASHLMQTTSLLRNPVFINNENYSGNPAMTRHPLLRAQLLSYFGEDVKSLPKAVFIPLGDKVAAALRFVADQGCIDHSRILDGMPHPSGANAERIAYFLGKKSLSELSVKTNPAKLDLARDLLTRKVIALA